MRIAIAIEKEIPWRGGPERFSNVYHYDTNVDVTLANASQCIDAIVTFERPVHGASVLFKVGRLWTTGQGAAQNETILIKDLSGTGSMSVSTDFYRELCVVVNSYTGRNTSTGKRIFLRKYIHSMGIPVSGLNQAIGNAALTSTMKAPFLTYGDQIQEVVPVAGLTMTLESPSGFNLSPSADVTVLDYPRIRQFTR